MSTPKKPGTDLAALKARLAKKPGGPSPDQVPPPGQQVQPPRQAFQQPPMAAPQPQAPPPEAAAPLLGGAVPQSAESSGSRRRRGFRGGASQSQSAGIPAPGQVVSQAPVSPASHAAPPAAAAPDVPFGGGTSFDPSEGVIDVGGEVQSRGSRGLIVFAMFGGIAIGAVVGYLVNQIVSKGALVETGRAKGAAMVEEVEKVAETRKTISLAMDDLKQTIAQDPKAGAEKITNLLMENFEKHPKVDELFGWQLAAVHSTGVKRVFDLYEEANGLKLDLGYLAGFLNEYGQALTAGGGPAAFAVINTGGAVKLVEAIKPLCDMESQTPCDDKDSKNAVGYLVRHDVGAEPVPAPRGTDEKHALLVAAEGNVYQYAFGLEPNKNAVKVYASLIGKVAARLEAMNKAEKVALLALKNYAESPTVDDSTSPQSDPGGAS